MLDAGFSDRETEEWVGDFEDCFVSQRSLALYRSASSYGLVANLAFLPSPLVR